MDSVLLVIHLLACTALIGAVLLQRSEGGALGMGGGGGGGLISGRGAADVLVRTTMILGAAFFVTSLTLARLNTDETKALTPLQRELQEREEDVFDPLSPVTPASGVAAPAQSGSQSGSQSAVPSGAPGSTPPAPVADPLAPVIASPPPTNATPPPAGAAPSPSPAGAGGPPAP